MFDILLHAEWVVEQSSAALSKQVVAKSSVRPAASLPLRASSARFPRT
jgi:hypothetical protein